MVIRPVKQRSDRGKIKDIVNAFASDSMELELAPTSFELRAKSLYEYAQLHKNKELLAQTGFITTDYIADKNALPLSAYRLRQIVDDIKSKSAGRIDKLSQELSGCMTDELSPETVSFLKTRRAMVKNASVRKPPAFWRVSRK